MFDSVTSKRCLWVCESENVLLNVWYLVHPYFHPIICPISGCRPQGLILPFTLTSTEITTPIKRLFPDILASKAAKRLVLFFTSKGIIPLFLPLNQHLPLGCVRFLSNFPFSSERQNLL